MWLTQFESLYFEFIKGITCVIALVFLLRITGKKTLSKMNAFDFIITLAIGSTLSSIIINKQITVADGIVTLSLIIGIQYIITWLSVRSPKFQSLIKSRPSILFSRGEFKENKMRAERVTKDEILMAMRHKGLADPSEADYVLLESDGQLSVLPKKEKSSQLGTLGTVDIST